MNIKRIFSQSSLPKKKEIINAIKTFPKTRKIVFLVFACVFFVSTVAYIDQVAIQPFQQEIPAEGGKHNEGIIGTPRFVNPVLSFSNADKDIESLVFSGLTRKIKDGSIVLDLADDFSVSQDNLIYTFSISEDAYFQDKTPVTANDVVFTIQKIQNPEIKSPKQVLWEGVKVEALDEKTVRFTLKQPFINFLENTSIGILPSHLWKDVAVDEFAFSELNIQPVGAGKYKITDTTKKKGLVETYTLKTSRFYSGEKPFIKKIHLYFFGNESEAIKALKNGQIQGLAGISPESVSNLPNNTTVYTATLHRAFGLFFNSKENSPIQSKIVRQAIDNALDRETVIDSALNGFGVPIKSPLPTTIPTNNPEKEVYSANTQKAETLLEQDGWIMGLNGIRQKNGVPLSIHLTTASIPELEKAAEEIKNELQKVGIEVIVHSLEIDDLNQNVIRPRNFEMLLFGQMLNQEADIFAFWHSSQVSDPGLNITSYKNTTVDKSLEKIIQTFDVTKRLELYNQFENEFFKDIPAVFIYSPELIYAVRGNIHNIELSPITNSSQRLLDIETWYKETNHVF